MLALTRTVTVRNSRMFPARAVDSLPLARCGWVSHRVASSFENAPVHSTGSRTTVLAT
jgi:hypothetical protein